MTEEMGGGILTKEILEAGYKEMCKPQEPSYILASGIPNEELYWLISHTGIKVLVHPSQMEYIKRRLGEDALKF